MTEKKRRRLGKLGDVAQELADDKQPEFSERPGTPVVIPHHVGKGRRTVRGAAAHEPWREVDEV